MSEQFGPLQAVKFDGRDSWQVIRVRTNGTGWVQVATMEADTDATKLHAGLRSSPSDCEYFAKLFAAAPKLLRVCLLLWDTGRWADTPDAIEATREALQELGMEW